MSRSAGLRGRLLDPDLPAYWLYQNVTDAYEAIKAINAVLMSLAAVPTYLLARRVLGRGLALVAAALAVALPSMVYTSTVMTEVAFSRSP